MQIWGNNKRLNKIRGVVNVFFYFLFFVKELLANLVGSNLCNEFSISLVLLINKVVVYFVLKIFIKKNVFGKKGTHCSAISHIQHLKLAIFYSCAKYYYYKEKKKGKVNFVPMKK